MLVLLFLRAGAGVCGGGGVGVYIIITGAFFFSGGPFEDRLSLGVDELPSKLLFPPWW